MINYIAICDIFSLLAIIFALVICTRLPSKKVSKETVHAIVGLLVAIASYETLIAIEWLGITDKLDFLEDYIGALLPLCWLFAFYIMTQSLITNRLIRSEQRFAYSMEATSDGLWDWEIPTGKVYFSPHWFNMLGYSPQELPSKYETWLSLLHPEDLEISVEEVQKALDLQSSFKHEFRLKTKEGNWLWVLARGKVVEHSADGKPLRMVGTHVDISLRKEREVQIRKLQQYLSGIIDSMPSVLIGIDSNFIVTLWNSQAVATIGITAEEAIGEPLGEVFPRLQKDFELIRMAIQSGMEQHDNHRILTTANREYYEDLTVYPLRTEDLQGTIIQIDDVTERVQMEEMIIQSEKMLSLGGLAAGLAHEINSPLSGITISAYNLKRRLLENIKNNTQTAVECDALMEAIQCYMERRNVPRILDSISEACSRTTKLVRNILSFSRKSARQMEYTNLAALINQTYELVASDHQITKIGLKDIEVIYDFSTDVPDVKCDESMIQQVLFNVFRNGLEAMSDKDYGPDHPIFKFKIYSEDGFAVMEILDNGPGMDDTIKDKIFNAFYTTKAPGSGTGLGLSVSYFIVTELHGGTMEVMSTPDEFTCFIIRLPLSSHSGEEVIVHAPLS